MRVDMFLGAVSLAAGIAGSEFVMRRQVKRQENRQAGAGEKTVFEAQRLPIKAMLHRATPK